jgi:hypothetical protein
MSLTGHPAAVKQNLALGSREPNRAARAASLRETIDARETALAQVTRHPAPYSIYRYPAFC